jgi:hypothetical protein
MRARFEINVPDDSPLRLLPEDVQRAILAELIAAYAEGREPDREKLRELMGRPVWVVYGDQARPEEGR